jgi:hypothetical protein
VTIRAQNQNFQTPASRFSPNNDRGPSNFDARHSFNAVASYFIPYKSTNAAARALFSDYSLDARVRAISGRPVNVVTGRDPFPLGFSTVARPDLVVGQPLYLKDAGAPEGK